MSEGKSGGGGGGRKRKGKGKYFHGGKKSRTGGRRELQKGMRGFILTTNNQEPQTVKEALNILEEHFDKFISQSGEEWREREEQGKGSDSEGEQEEDIQDMIEKECAALKEDAKWTFREAQTGIKNCIFIQMKSGKEDPSELAHSILEEIGKGSGQSCRFVQRLIPVQTSCRAYVEDLRKAAGPLITAEFQDSRLTFEVQFRARNNHDLTRAEILSVIPELVTQVSPLSRVNLDRPDRSILVEVLKGVCCFSIVKDFKKLKKFNLFEMSKSCKETGKVSQNSSESAVASLDGDKTVDDRTAPDVH